MRKAKSLIIFLCLFSFFLTGDNADETSEKIYYHWITKNTLYLWKDSDREPVKVELDKEEWLLPPADIISNQDWAALIRTAVPLEYLKDISTNDNLWMVFLNYIYEQKPEDKKVRLKYPDVSLYFHLTSENSGEFTFIFQKEIFSFYFNLNEKNKKWEKKGNISLVTMLGLKEELEFKKIFEKVLPGSEKNEWSDFWNTWIKHFTKITEPYSCFYENAGGKGQWLLIEKIESANFTERMRPQPPKPEIVTKTEKIEAEPKVITQTIPLYIILIICAIVFLTNPLSSFLFKFYRLRKMASLSKEKYQQTLDDMERKDKNLLEGVKGLMGRIQGLQLKRENLIDVSVNKIKEISENEKYVKLGKSAYLYYEKSKKKDGSDLGEDNWFAYQFKEFEKNKKNLEKKDEELRKLNEENESIKKEKEKILEELGKIEEVKGEKLIEKWDSFKKLFEGEKDFLKTTKEELEAKQNQLMGINTDMEKILKPITALEIGLHKALDNSKDEGTNITAMVSFLVYYSLFNLSNAVVHGEEKKKKMMLANLFNISEKLKEPYAVFKNVKLNEFGAFFKQLQDDFPGITDEKIEVSKKEPKNARFFQDLLKRLRDISDSQLDFGPYYYGIDESSKAYRAM